MVDFQHAFLWLCSVGRIGGYPLGYDDKERIDTVISRLSTQLDLEMALRTYAGGACLTVLCPIARTGTVCVHGQPIFFFEEFLRTVLFWNACLKREVTAIKF